MYMILNMVLELFGASRKKNNIVGWLKIVCN